jgi:hypothetical protein
MKFSELLNKKKKTKMEENQTTENAEQKDILEQNESVNNDVPEIDENSTQPDDEQISDEEKLKAVDV